MAQNGYKSKSFKALPEHLAMLEEMSRLRGKATTSSLIREAIELLYAKVKNQKTPKNGN
jgi:hypothetical protein